VDPSGCQEILKLGQVDYHESNCPFGLVECPNSQLCQKVQRRYLPAHLEICRKTPCPNKSGGCQFEGTRTEVEKHYAQCPCQSNSKIKDSNLSIAYSTRKSSIFNFSSDLTFLKGSYSLFLITQKKKKKSYLQERTSIFLQLFLFNLFSSFNIIFCSWKESDASLRKAVEELTERVKYLEEQLILSRQTTSGSFYNELEISSISPTFLSC